MAPLQNHTLSVGEEVQGEGPELTFDAYSEGVVPHVTTELPDPLVLVQPDRRGSWLRSRRANVDFPEAGSPQISPRGVWCRLAWLSFHLDDTKEGYGTLGRVPRIAGREPAQSG